jgi:hypothetical protein
MLLGIPGCRVGSAGLEGKLLLGEADTSTTASIGAGGSLASNTLIVGEAGTLSGASIADTHIGALHDRVNIVRVGDISDPSVVPVVWMIDVSALVMSELKTSSILYCCDKAEGER